MERLNKPEKKNKPDQRIRYTDWHPLSGFAALFLSCRALSCLMVWIHAVFTEDSFG
ncbi:MAG: hypothetical protein IKN57_10765 [Parasporobacterium sp.]|nr:hypothetical protein [Parasporobacterium sp.]